MRQEGRIEMEFNEAKTINSLLCGIIQKAKVNWAALEWAAWNQTETMPSFSFSRILFFFVELVLWKKVEEN